MLHIYVFQWRLQWGAGQRSSELGWIFGFSEYTMPVFYYTILFGLSTVFVHLCPNKEFKFHFKLVSDKTTKTQLLHQNSLTDLFFIVSKWATLSWPDAGFVNQDLAALQLGQLLQFFTLLHAQVKATPFFTHCTQNPASPGWTQTSISAPEGRCSALESPAFPHHENSLPWFHSYVPQIINTRQCVSEKWSERGINTTHCRSTEKFWKCCVAFGISGDTFLNLEGHIRVVSSEGSDKAAWWF